MRIEIDEASKRHFYQKGYITFEDYINERDLQTFKEEITSHPQNSRDLFMFSPIFLSSIEKLKLGYFAKELTRGRSFQLATTEVYSQHQFSWTPRHFFTL